VEPSARDAFQATIVRKGVADAHNGDVIKIVPDSVTDGRYVLEVVTPEGSRSVVGDTAASIERAQEQALEAARLNPEFRPKSSQTETVSDPEPSPKDATVSSKPSAPATEGYQALPEKTRTLFESALDANDGVKLAELLYVANKTLRAEFTARTGVKLPRGVQASKDAITKYVSILPKDATVSSKPEEDREPTDEELDAAMDAELDRLEKEEAAIKLVKPKAKPRKSRSKTGKETHPPLRTPTRKSRRTG
jgi:hypothetical protein